MTAGLVMLLKRQEAVLCVYAVKKRRRKERSIVIAHEEELNFGGNMASPAGCKHYVRSCLMKVS